MFFAFDCKLHYLNKGGVTTQQLRIGLAQGSFDSCVEKQVDFVSWQNNVITGYIVGGLGFLALGALAWCYRDSIVGYLTSCCRRAPQYNAANQV